MGDLGCTNQPSNIKMTKNRHSTTTMINYIVKTHIPLNPTFQKSLFNNHNANLLYLNKWVILRSINKPSTIKMTTVKPKTNKKSNSFNKYIDQSRVTLLKSRLKLEKRRRYVDFGALNKAA